MKETYCARRDPLVLPIDGAPLVFATDYAHGMTLSVPTSAGTIELPAVADPTRGGFLIDASALHGVNLGGDVRATLHGTWGFDHYEGPAFTLVDTRAATWTLAPGEASALIVGREDTVHLIAGSVSCLAEVTVTDAAGKATKVDWKGVGADQAELKLALQNAVPGDLTLLVQQYGVAQPQRLALHAYAEGGRLDGFSLHAGDRAGILRGTRLDKVDRLVLNDVEFTPGSLSNASGQDELTMQAAAAAPISLKSGDAPTARVSFKDGRSYEVHVSVITARPSAVLISKSAQGVAAGSPGNIRLGNQDELPQDARLTFALRAQSPAAFSHDDKVEVATSDGSSSALLDFGSGAMQLESAKVAVATLDPAKLLGASAFGPLHYRVVSSGIAGDWRPLATLVRLPVLRRLECPGGGEGSSCKLSGANLFLIDSVAGNPQFSQPTPVPDGYTEQSLSVPRPTEGQLYVRLRDDPSVINVATVDVTFAAPPAATVPAAAPDNPKPAGSSNSAPAAPATVPEEAKPSPPSG
jgi:hypothetical protein